MEHEQLLVVLGGIKGLVELAAEYAGLSHFTCSGCCNKTFGDSLFHRNIQHWCNACIWSTTDIQKNLCHLWPNCQSCRYLFYCGLCQKVYNTHMYVGASGCSACIEDFKVMRRLLQQIKTNPQLQQYFTL